MERYRGRKTGDNERKYWKKGKKTKEVKERKRILKERKGIMEGKERK